MTESLHTLSNGRYQIERVLGAGGMSLVFLAQDTRLGVHRALKLLRRPYAKSPELRSRFLNEAFAQADLRHPNILMVHDIVEDEENDSIFLVMELASGGSLADRVRLERPLSPREAVEVGMTIGKALGIAHAAGVIHRDIKPGNILVDRHGVLKLADFGIAQIQSRQQLTQTGALIGTWSFMPPEQRVDSHAADARADIYALGGSLFYMLTGRNPDSLHNRETHAAAFTNIPDLFAAIIQKATRFEPDDRYSTCEEMIAALQKIQGSMGDEPVVQLTPAPLPQQLSLDEVLFSYYTEAGGQLPQKGDLSETVIPHPDDLIPTRIPDSSSRPIRSSSPTIAPPLTPPTAGHSALLAALAGLVASVATVGLLAWLLLPHLLTPQPVLTDPPTVDILEVPPEATPAEPPVEVVEAVPPPSTAPVVAPAADPIQADPPPSGRTGPRIISVLPGSPISQTDTTPPTAPVRNGPQPTTGAVVIRTVPSGVTVRESGEVLSAGSDGYALSIGRHNLELQSTSGEITQIPVDVRAGRTIDICYNFDTNSACVK
ncbi:MAG: protein kinase [Myxococcota bacterium]|nr:protein kinase [Myxococcota bacterium]